MNNLKKRCIQNICENSIDYIKELDYTTNTKHKTL